MEKPTLDSEYQTRLEAARVSAEWRAPITTLTPQRSLEDLPLFGGVHQRSLLELLNGEDLELT